MSTTITIPAEAIEVVCDALVIELESQTEAAHGDLHEHLGGSSVGLADARPKCERITQLAAVLDALDPPGWRSTLAEHVEPDASTLAEAER